MALKQYAWLTEEQQRLKWFSDAHKEYRKAVQKVVQLRKKPKSGKLTEGQRKLKAAYSDLCEAYDGISKITDIHGLADVGCMIGGFVVEIYDIAKDQISMTKSEFDSIVRKIAPAQEAIQKIINLNTTRKHATAIFTIAMDFHKVIFTSLTATNDNISNDSKKPPDTFYASNQQVKAQRTAQVFINEGGDQEAEDPSDTIDRAFMEAGIGDYKKADMRYFMESGLSDSLIFHKLNDSSSITQRIEQIIKSGTVVEKDFIEEQYNQISKTHLSPLADKVLQAYDEGEIVLIYNKNQHLTIALPFVVMKMKGRYRSLIFISDFSGVTKDGSSLNIEMKKLYTIMEAALVGLRYYTNSTLFSRSSVLAKMSSMVYTEMCLRILNKEFALSLNKEAYDMISYSLARFYLEKIFGLSSAEVIHSYARGVCKSPDETTINIVRGMYDTTEIATIEDLLKFFIELYPKMERLSFRYFFERWVSSYAIGATLAIDNFPYLYYVMLSVLLGSFMINNTALNDMVKNIKGMANFHPEVARIV